MSISEPASTVTTAEAFSSPCSSKAINIEPDNTFYIYDVGTYYKKVKDLSDKEILDLIKNVFVPDKSFKLPKDKNNRSFRLVWLEMFPWLCYS